MFIDYVILALKNVRKRGIRSWLTMLGVFVGIAAVVSLISLGNGLETAITGQFGALSVDTLLIQGADTGFAPPGTASVTKISEKELEIIQGTSGVRIAIPRYFKAGEIKYNDIVGFGFIASVPNDKEQMQEVYDSLNLDVEQGKFLEVGDRGRIIVGNDYVRTEVYGKEIKLGSNLEIDGTSFEVAGILEKSSAVTFNSVILMMEDDVKSVFEVEPDNIDFVAARVYNKDEIENVAEDIKRKIRQERKEKEGEEDFEVQTPSQSLQTVNTILSVINIVVTGIALIALLVGGIGIANTMFTSVLERTKEIGVMKAVGAKNSDILKIFLTESAVLGLVGGVIGALIGLSLAFIASVGANAALGSDIFAVAISAPLLLGSISFSLLVGILSGIVPALQASKLNPVEALRR